VKKEVTESEGQFQQILSTFLETAEKEYEELSGLVSTMQILFQDLCVAYGEDPKIVQPDLFFSTILRFLTNLEVIIFLFIHIDSISLILIFF
jgi:hypothetical protein